MFMVSKRSKYVFPGFCVLLLVSDKASVLWWVGERKGSKGLVLLLRF